MHSEMISVSDILQEAYFMIGEEIDNHPYRLRTLASKNQSISFHNGKERTLFHLISGEIEIRNIKNNLIVVNVHAPAILGLSNIMSNENFYYIHTVSSVELSSIPNSELVNIANQKNLWNHISVILSYYINIYYLRDILLSQTSVYEIIKTHLEILWSLNKEKINDTSVFEYILNRTPVSRSSLNKVLKDLSTGGYIKIKRGKLIELNKLPQGY